MPRIGMLTLGCRVNQSETRELRNVLSGSGFILGNIREKADVYIVNTCTVTSRADQKAREWIRLLARRHENAEIIVTGCYARRSGETLKSISGRIRIMENRGEIAGYLKRKKEFLPGTQARPAVQPGGADRTRVFLKIQDGCGKYCNYCIVPYVRSSISYSSEREILEEAEALAEGGVKEVVLCAINFEYYPDLTGLIEKLESVRGLKRLRLSSIEPACVSEKLIAAAARSRLLCRHLHIPLQSGSDRVLKLMGRAYTAAEYAAIVDRIRSSMGDAGITTDVIAGYPGETAEEFEETCKFTRAMGFSKMHVFRYSDRPMTRASKAGSKIPENEKKRRSAILLGIEEKNRK